MFDGILSPAAAQLYDELRNGATVVVESQSEVEQAPLSPMQELQQHGLAKQTFDDPPRLVALEPRAAVTTSITRLLDQISDHHRALSQTIAEALSLQIDDPRLEGSGAVRVLTNGREINFLSGAMTGAAKHEGRFLNTGDFARADHAEAVGLSEKQREHGVILRSIYDVQCLPVMNRLIEDSIALGEDARIFNGVPIKMIMVDAARAMLPLDRTGTRGALLIESAPIINALDCLFEFIWERAIPYSATENSNTLTPLEQRVLTQLATGSKDEAVAQRLNVTVRTVRRHITSAVNKLGAENRFAAGVLAARRGWI